MERELARHSKSIQRLSAAIEKLLQLVLHNTEIKGMAFALVCEDQIVIR